MHKYILLLSLLFIIGNSIAQESAPDQFRISFIDIKGNVSTDEQLLKSIAGLYVGKEIRKTGSDLSNTIKKLYERGLFDQVEVLVERGSEGGYGIVIKVEEVTRLKDFNITGLSKNELRSLKEKLGLRKGMRINSKMISNVHHQITSYFSEKGYHHVKVIIESPEEGNLSITVFKNERIKLSKLVFEGNERFSNRKLQRAIKSIRQQGEMSLVSRRFGPESITLLSEELASLYHQHGFVDFEMSIDSVFNATNDEVILQLTIHEGKRYHINQLTIEGNEAYTNLELMNLLDVEVGDIYNPELIQQRVHYDPKKTDLSGLYMDDGYLFFQADILAVPESDDQMNITIQITEGQQATINDIKIKGNHITNEEVLLREITTLPGDVFRRSEVMRSQSNLAMLGYLDPEKINVVPYPNPDKGTVDLEYYVAERPNDRIELTGTWGAVTGLTGSLGFTLNNFSMANLFKPKRWNPYPNGNGETMAIRFQSNGEQYNSYSLQYSNPWIGEHKPVNFFSSLVHTRVANESTETLEDGTVISETERLNITVVKFGLAHRLDWHDPFWTISNSISLNKYTFRNYENALDMENGESYHFILNSTLSRNNINHPFYPTTGTNLSFGLSLTPPYSLFLKEDRDFTSYKWAEYFKLMVDMKYHKAIVGKLVFKTGTHLGWINNYSNKNGLGPFERFQMGGSGLTGYDQFLGNEVISLRGYPTEAIVPITDDGLEGGTLYNKFNVELRYPILLSSGMSAYIYGFAEAGNAWGTISNYDPFRLYKAAGLGVQLSIPMMGQVGFNWGYGFDKLPGQSKVSGGNFQFTLGIPIR